MAHENGHTTPTDDVTFVLHGGLTLDIEADFKQVVELLRGALRDGAPFELSAATGETYALNPAQVIYVKSSARAAIEHLNGNGNGNGVGATPPLAARSSR